MHSLLDAPHFASRALSPICEVFGLMLDRFRSRFSCRVRPLTRLSSSAVLRIDPLSAGTLHCECMFPFVKGCWLGAWLELLYVHACSLFAVRLPPQRDAHRSVLLVQVRKLQLRPRRSPQDVGCVACARNRALAQSISSHVPHRVTSLHPCPDGPPH